MKHKLQRMKTRTTEHVAASVRQLIDVEAENAALRAQIDALREELKAIRDDRRECEEAIDTRRAVDQCLARLIQYHPIQHETGEFADRLVRAHQRYGSGTKGPGLPRPPMGSLTYSFTLGFNTSVFATGDATYAHGSWQWRTDQCWDRRT